MRTCGAWQTIGMAKHLLLLSNMRHNNSSNNNNNNTMTIAMAIASIWRSKATCGEQEVSNQASEQDQPASTSATAVGWERNESRGGSAGGSTDSASNIGSRQLNTSQTFYCVIGAGKSVVQSTQSGRRSVGGGGWVDGKFRKMVAGKFFVRILQWQAKVLCVCAMGKSAAAITKGQQLQLRQ